MRSKTWIPLVVLFLAGCEAVSSSAEPATAPPVVNVTMPTAELVEAIKSLRPAPQQADEWGGSPADREPSAAEKAVERLAVVLAEQAERQAKAPPVVPVQPPAQASVPDEQPRKADDTAGYTGAVILVSDPPRVSDGTSDCVPCNRLVLALRAAVPGKPWTVSVERNPHFWLRQSTADVTPIVNYYRDGVRVDQVVGFGGTREETVAILKRHPQAETTPPKQQPVQSPERRWTRSPAPPVQGAAFRDEWDGGGGQPQPYDPGDGGGSCAGPQQFGCAAPQVQSFGNGCGGGWQTTWRAVPQVWSRPLAWTCRNGVCRWE